jgi:asparagine synthetase B (glutamine-hydrolysing)
MCGISGIWGSTRKTDEAEGMMKLMAHRGPDADGMFVCPEGSGVLGHRMLSSHILKYSDV